MNFSEFYNRTGDEVSDLPIRLKVVFESSEPIIKEYLTEAPIVRKPIKTTSTAKAPTSTNKLGGVVHRVDVPVKTINPTGAVVRKPEVPAKTIKPTGAVVRKQEVPVKTTTNATGAVVRNVTPEAPKTPVKPAGAVVRAITPKVPVAPKQLITPEPKVPEKIVTPEIPTKKPPVEEIALSKLIDNTHKNHPEREHRALHNVSRSSTLPIGAKGGGVDTLQYNYLFHPTLEKKHHFGYIQSRNGKLIEIYCDCLDFQYRLYAPYVKRGVAKWDLEDREGRYKRNTYKTVDGKRVPFVHNKAFTKQTNPSGELYLCKHLYAAIKDYGLAKE